MNNTKILCQKKYSPETNKHYEGAFTQGNGYVNIRASFEEDLPGESQTERYWRLPANVTLEKIRNPVSKWGIYVPGIYGMHPILGEEIVNLPYLLGINIYCKEEKFSMRDSVYHSFEKTLDAGHGILKRRLTWITKQGDIRLTWMRYPSMEQPHMIVQQLVFETETDMELVVESFIEGDVTTNGYQHITDCHSEMQGGLTQYIKLDSGQLVGMRCISHSLGEADTSAYKQSGGRIKEVKKITVRARQPITYQKFGFIVTSIDENASGTEKERLAQMERELLAHKPSSKRQEEIWDSLWEKAGVEIEGDDHLQQCLNFSIYHLLRSANCSNSVAIDAKGFAGEAYFGHYFWDTEIYLLPFYNAVWPEQAKRLIQFRYKTLNGARENAKRYGYPGARYPWEACATGLEQCSNWQYADLEVHVTADVVYGIWQYCTMTGDMEFLMGKGLEIMVETARFWAARVSRQEDGIHLNGVMGPDEYLPFTNDNAYTNKMVCFALEKTATILKSAPKDRWQELGVTEKERKEFQNISKALVIYKDAERSLIWQCQDFEKFETIDFNKVWKDRTKPFGSCISQEQNYRSKALKQADVATLLYLFWEEFNQETIASCMAYYEPLTTHDSSLSYIVHSLIYSRLGELEKSFEFMEKSMDIDWGSNGAAEGIHIANAGGLWQGVIKGIGGFQGIEEHGRPVVEPKLPKHITKLTYRLCTNSIWYRVAVSQQGVEIVQLDDSKA